MCGYEIGLASNRHFLKILSLPTIKIPKVITMVGFHSRSTCLGISRSQRYGYQLVHSVVQRISSWIQLEVAIFPKLEASCKIGSPQDPSPLSWTPYWAMTSINTHSQCDILGNYLDIGKIKLLCFPGSYRPQQSPAKWEIHLDPQEADRFFLEEDCKSKHKMYL